MRALILILAATVVALAVMIVAFVDAGASYVHRTGPTFHIGGLIANANAGEFAMYREKTSGRVVEFRVVQSPPLPPFAVPYKVIRRRLFNAKGIPYEGPTGSVTYNHSVTEHGFLPLTAPEVPDALDRQWIIRSIKPDRLAVHQTATAVANERDCWRVDLLDPALPDGQDTVVAWFDVNEKVFGLLKWKRGGETWEYVRSGPWPRKEKP